MFERSTLKQRVIAHNINQTTPPQIRSGVRFAEAVLMAFGGGIAVVVFVWWITQ